MNNFPRRIVHSGPPGHLLKRTCQPRERRQEVVGRDVSYLALLRELPCLKCGMEPCGTAAHLRMNSGLYNKRQALARKPSDEWTTPLCSGCHLNDTDAQHRIGEREFWDRLGINPFLACQELYAARGDFVRLRAVALRIISERR